MNEKSIVFKTTTMADHNLKHHTISYKTIKSFYKVGHTFGEHVKVHKEKAVCALQ